MFYGKNKCFGCNCLDYCYCFGGFGHLRVDKMIKIQDLLFWIIMGLIIGLAIWLVSGSPTIESGLVSLALFVVASEILLWKALFKMDKNTSIGFFKVKKEIQVMKYKLERDMQDIKENIGEIKRMMKKENKQ